MRLDQNMPQLNHFQVPALQLLVRGHQFDQAGFVFPKDVFKLRHVLDRPDWQVKPTFRERDGRDATREELLLEIA